MSISTYASDKLQKLLKDKYMHLEEFIGGLVICEYNNGSYDECLQFYIYLFFDNHEDMRYYNDFILNQSGLRPSLTFYSDWKPMKQNNIGRQIERELEYIERVIIDFGLAEIDGLAPSDIEYSYSVPKEFFYNGKLVKTEN